MQSEAPNRLDSYAAGLDPAGAPRPRQDVEVPAAVLWHDGMPLAPQHFQESFRRTERLFDFHLGLVAPYHYGVTRLEIDGGRLGSGVLHVDVEAVMPDRLRARAPAEALSIKLDVAEFRKRAGDEFNVFLAVPWEHPGRAAVGESPRYHTAEGEALADDTTGESTLQIARLVPNVQLLVDVKPPTSSTWVRIAKVRIDGDGFVRVAHVPPLFAVSREPHARILYDLCAGLIERVRNAARRLSERRATYSKSAPRSPSTDGVARDDHERLVETKQQIQSLVAALPPFEALLHTERAHPFALYIALSGLVGVVAGLSRSLVPPVLSVYRHDDLLATFEEAVTHVDTMMREGIVKSFAPHPLVESFAPHPLEAGRGRRYQVEFPRAWVGRQLVLVLRGLRGRREADVTGWMKGAIIASLSDVERVRGTRALGVARERVDNLGDLYPAGGELLFELKDASAALPDQPLTVFNPSDKSSDVGAFEVVLYVKEPPSDPQATSPRSGR